MIFVFYDEPSMVSLFKNIGLTEIIIAAVILIVLFGGKKITELSRGLGQSTKELKKIKKEITGEPEKTGKGGAA